MLSETLELYDALYAHSSREETAALIRRMCREGHAEELALGDPNLLQLAQTLAPIPGNDSCRELAVTIIAQAAQHAPLEKLFERGFGESETASFVDRACEATDNHYIAASRTAALDTILTRVREERRADLLLQDCDSKQSIFANILASSQHEQPFAGTPRVLWPAQEAIRIAVEEGHSAEDLLLKLASAAVPKNAPAHTPRLTTLTPPQPLASFNKQAMCKVKNLDDFNGVAARSDMVIVRNGNEAWLYDESSNRAWILDRQSVEGHFKKRAQNHGMSDLDWEKIPQTDTALIHSAAKS